MTYDSAVAVKRNEIDYMLQSLQSDISDGKTTWVFVIKQLSDVFHIINFFHINKCAVIHNINAHSYYLMCE
jgi:hypothetical protein